VLLPVSSLKQRAQAPPVKTALGGLMLSPMTASALVRAELSMELSMEPATSRSAMRTPTFAI
jgi:hypothetical protein